MAVSPEIETLIRVSWILLIPIGVLLSLVLYKLVFILHALSEFLTLARYELTPAMKELRLTADHLESLSAKALVGVETVGQAVESTRPRLQALTHNTGRRLSAVFRGFCHAFDTQR